LHDWGVFYGPLGAQPAATLTAVLRFLRSQPRDWDLLDLRWVNTREIDRGRTPVALEAAGFPCRASVWRTTACVDFTGNWEEYLATRTEKFRSSLRRAESAAARAGHLEFERYRPAGARFGDGDPRWDLLDDCLTVASRSWQGSSETGTTLCHSTVSPFFQDLFAVAARAGGLDVNLLRLDGQPIAFTLNLHAGGNIAGLRMGFDPEWSALSPGRLLLARSFADSFRRGDRRLDLGSESMPFKLGWLTQTIDSYRYTHFPWASWRSQLLRMKHWLRPASRCPRLGELETVLCSQSRPRLGELETATRPPRSGDLGYVAPSERGR
jgi:hypothetical protein